MLPLLAAMATLSGTVDARDRVTVHDELLGGLGRVTDSLRHTVERTGGILLALNAVAPDLVNDEALCTASLARLVAQVPEAVAVGITDAQGAFRCHVGAPMGPGLSAMMTTGRAAVTTRPAAPGADDASVEIIWPFRGQDGASAGAVTIGLPLRLEGGYGVPSDGIVLLVDPAGTVLTVAPLTRGWSGTPLGIHGLDPLGGRLQEDVVIDGVPHLVAQGALSGPTGLSLATVWVAVPSATAYRPVQGSQSQLIIGAAVVFFVALLGIGVTANRLLVAPMDRLVATARRLSPNRLPADMDDDEFSTLTLTLAGLAAARGSEAAPFRAAVTAAEEGVLIVQSSGRITFANAAAGRALSGRQDQLVGAGAHAVLHGPEANHAESACPILASLRDGQARRGQIDAWMRGHHHRVHVSWSSIPIEDGSTPSRVVLLFEDRTWRNRIEEGLRRSARMEAVGQLAGGIAHDFNNLLTAILGYGDLLRHRLQARRPPPFGAGGDNEAALFEIEELLRAGHRAAALTRQLLTVSRPRAPGGDLCDLNELVREMERLLRRLIGASIHVQLELDPAVAAIRADPSGVEQVLLNLVLNARDAMPHGGVLTLRTLPGAPTATAPRVWLVVADTGIGMAPEIVEQIFEPFFTTKATGTGIGLATVARIVQDAEGELHVDSEPGRGTTFRVGWPGLPPESSSPLPPSDPGPLSSGQGTLLVVAGDDTICSLARRTLTICGYTVIEARDEAGAVDALDTCRQPVDLLVADVDLPGATGPALLDRLRRHTPGLRVLYLVNDGDRLAGGAPTLTRPFTSHDLATAVAAAVRSG